MAQFSKNTDDSELWRLFREGDEDAYTTMANRYYAKLIHYGQKFTSDRQIVEDALQDVLVRLWVSRRTLKDTPSVKFYLLKAFRHQLFKAMQNFPRNPTIQDDTQEYNMEFSAEDHYIQQETEVNVRNEVDERLAHLPLRQREVIYLRYFQSLTIEEIADILTIRPQSVSNLVQRALAKLRESWPIILFLILDFLSK
ncbi:hypothetical protein SD10_11740 [Spirosoma radiotolerans]|uniref:RNA polymerase subunit sigma-24 n=2 Tax=Spirosoma radiotolerans TaxID=1379870 RepID=A0A0E3V708_9BACT|nr:hypothetical protein SD10_11740 [Spirosoma radiotolerans]